MTRKGGAGNGLWDKPRSGAPKHLRSDQEEAFLERIAQRPKPEDQIKVVLVWDNAGFHRSKDLEIPQNITLVPQAPYSPELNPVERIWRWVKTNVLGNSIFKGIKDLFTAGITAWESLTDILLKSICSTKWLGRTN